MLPTWTVVYLAIGVVLALIGLITMLPRRRELRNPRVFLRTIGFGIVAVLLWPGIVLLGIVWQFPAGRTWMIASFRR